MSANPLRVLIVDDEQNVADTLALIARGEGCVTRTAYSAEQATQIANEFHPHAAISDVMLPGMDGLELNTWLEEHHPACTVLLISGHPDTEARLERCAKAGTPRAVLAKPFHPCEFLKFLTACTP